MIKKAICIAFFFLSIPLQLNAAENHVLGGFEMSGFFNAGFGWQRFGGGPPTEFDYDGSYAGVLGSVVPDIAAGPGPAEGQDVLEAFMEVFELDITKTISDRATLRADLLFGRTQSGSWVNIPDGIEVEMGYATVVLLDSPRIDLTVGRIGTPVGFEPFEPYFNDTISWSVLTRAILYPYIVTGAQFMFEISDGVELFISAANNLLNDDIFDIDEFPSGLATFKFSWGEDDKESFFTVSSYLGPESGGRTPLSFGFDSTLIAWVTDSLQLGLQGDFRRDNGDTGPATSYAGGLMNLHWDMTEQFYGGVRFCFARQFDEGNGVINLTGAEQNIYESSLFAGYHLTDSVKLKFEARVDVIDPSVGETQIVPGAAMAFAAAF